jgi:hypothetical protein
MSPDPIRVDDRVFQQIDALPPEDARRELASLISLADLGVIDRAIGDAARARALVLAPQAIPIPLPEDAPPGTQRDGYGFYTDPDGCRLCEACWQPIPAYVDFPVGLTSPESDGDAGGNFAKRRYSVVEGKAAVEALRTAVCLPCYLAAFQRVYPDTPLPDLNPEYRDVRVSEPPPPPLISIPWTRFPEPEDRPDTNGG